MIVLQGNLSLCSLGNMVLFEKNIFGQLTLEYYQKAIYFHPFHSWMKKRIQKKVQTQDLWAVKGILTTTLVFFL
jgi:hypothetical protein